ncbi:MAG: long-chain-fatty-acid CoA ligase [Enterovirga sp.]|nr:long-chain-fatty-acid CoA ligase [Enterovirga sp.]
MNIALWLDRAAKAAPNRSALGHGQAVVRRYGAFGERAARLAGALAGFGLVPGDRVAIFAKNSPAYAEALFAIWHAGLAAVPVNAKLHGAELAYVLEHSGARLCFVSGDAEGAAADHAPPSLERLLRLDGPDFERLCAADPVPVSARAPGDLAWLFYTSGTTGRPKGAMLSHGNLLAASFAYAMEVDPIEAGDSLLHAAPMSHGSGLYIMAQVARLGVNVVPESGGFEPDEIAATFAAWRRMSMFAAPTMVKRLVAGAPDFDPEAIRTIIYGGAPMYVEDARAALDRFGPRFAQIYGQGESPMTITLLPKSEIADGDHPRWLERLGSAGRAYACIETCAMGEDGTPLPPGETGEVVARGTPVMSGYWRDEAATAAALRGGWLHTGDVGAFDEAGYLTLKDRSKDVVISGGTNIYPREVEEVLLTHSGIREVSVIGRPDPDWGEVVVAYLVGTAPPAELDALCLSRIARFKRPKDYVFLDALPKNNYGKVLKTELRARDRLRTGPGGTP